MKMKNLILFDQDTLHYRQSIYRYFDNEFSKMGYKLIVVYDQNLNTIEGNELFQGMNYSYRNFVGIIKKYKPGLIIQFVWLKYKFLFPFMIYCKLKRIKSIVWSHGINLQNPNQHLKNYLYYFRQFLATALIIYSENEREYIKTSHAKLFIANNTLNYYDFPEIPLSKEDLKKKHGFQGKKIILSVARFNTMNRKVEYLIDLVDLIDDDKVNVVIAGPGIEQENLENIRQKDTIKYYGAVYDQVLMNELYKMADVFVMPGGLGLAINQCFFHGLPIVVEDVNHSPEIIYLKNGQNGFLFKEGDLSDLKGKVVQLLSDPELHDAFSRNAYNTARNEASFDRMVNEFRKAIRFTESV